jgi:hypothetical protein
MDLVSFACTKCGMEKPTTEFYPTRFVARGHESRCKECKIRGNLASSRKHYGAVRRRMAARTWTDADVYEKGVEVQGEHCAICGSADPRDKNEHFAVDHDHATGLVRGLLCGNCNRGIGFLEDSAERLQQAIEYLQAPPLAELKIYEKKTHEHLA